MDLILSLPTNIVETDIQWLPNIASEWNGIELYGTAVDDDSLWSGLADRLHLPVLHVHELLPTSVTRILPEAPIATRNRLTDHLRRMLERAAAMSVRTATLDFGLAVNTDTNWNDALDRRVELLLSLMPLAEALEIVICVDLRVPVTRGNDIINTRGVRLANEIMHPNCQLTLNVFPFDLPEDFDLAGLVKQYLFKVAVLRINFEPALGLRPLPEHLTEWHQALQRQNYRGSICFCPNVESPESCQREFERLAADLGTDNDDDDE
ncbi:MAG TPA: hypothetical protein DIT01_18085 [Lentisphaeria bacterium]|nr:hypothetical protein [Lentisphaeria bacterium]|tara:strand:- start:2645 stop:3439 length:795 start_codon:yes stop_codon:yes gene_type:complete